MSDLCLACIHPNLKQMSHSSDELLHTCPRRFELYKLSPVDQTRDEGNVDTAFGTAVGVGIQRYLETGSREKAVFDTFRAWRLALDEVQHVASRKTVWHAIYAVDCFKGIRDTYFGNYELAYFDGKPAVELGFQIDLGDGFVYRGFLDALLINKFTKELAVYEGKTTKYKSVNEAQFKYSGQSLGYSVVIDTLAPKLGLDLKSSYRVHYCIWKAGAGEWEPMPFDKNHTSRALWLKNLLIDKKHIQDYAEDDYFPQHGESCYHFFRQCEYFGICQMSNRAIVGENVPVKVDPPTKYPFKYTLEELIEAQLARSEV